MERGYKKERDINIKKYENGALVTENENNSRVVPEKDKFIINLSSLYDKLNYGDHIDVSIYTWSVKNSDPGTNKEG